jgi:microcystin-dependent protein
LSQNHFLIAKQNIMTVYIGTVCAFGFNFVPAGGWAYCNGQSLDINSYQALYALVGTTYGGNGVTTFNIPNLTNSSAIHQGQGPGTNLYQLGQAGGTRELTLTANNMPGHTHATTFALNANNSNGTAGTAAAGFPAHDTSNGLYATGPVAGVTMAPPIAQPVLGTAGGSNPISIESPNLMINYCIALFGLFPQRN